MENIAVMKNVKCFEKHCIILCHRRKSSVWRVGSYQESVCFTGLCIVFIYPRHAKLLCLHKPQHVSYNKLSGLFLPTPFVVVVVR